MKQVMTPMISNHILAEWETTYLPPFDLFFFSSFEAAQQSLGNHCLVMSREEFINHSDYNQIQAVNSYEYWRLSKAATYVCVAPPHLFPGLDSETQANVLREQKRLHRGLIYKWEEIERLFRNEKLAPINLEGMYQTMLPYRFRIDTEEYVAFQTSMWSLLPYKFKLYFLNHLALEYRDDNPELEADGLYLNLLKKKYPHIAKYFNTYPSKSGPNCFGSTLAALINDTQYSEWMLTHWVYPSGLENGLLLNNYKPIQVDIFEVLPKDVVVWKDENNDVQHASFHLQGSYFFNKDGQSFFNAWQIVKVEKLLTNWGSEGIHIFRKGD